MINSFYFNFFFISLSHYLFISPSHYLFISFYLLLTHFISFFLFSLFHFFFFLHHLLYFLLPIISVKIIYKNGLRKKLFMKMIYKYFDYHFFFLFLFFQKWL